MLQQADGSWPFSTLTCNLVSRSESNLIAACPSGVTKEMWITVIILVLLTRKCAAFLEELELIITKAEKWLLSQDGSTTITQLKEMAQVIVDSL